MERYNHRKKQLMKKFSLTITLALCSLFSYSQGNKYLFIEAGGASILGAVNFDIRLNKNDKNGFGLRAGIGNTLGLFDSKDVKDAIIFPIGINYIYGKNNGGIVFGFNTTFIVMDKKKEEQSNFIFAPEIGYRYRPKNKGVSFHISYTPLFNTVDGTMPVWLGAGIGYSW